MPLRNVPTARSLSSQQRWFASQRFFAVLKSSYIHIYVYIYTYICMALHIYIYIVYIHANRQETCMFFLRLRSGGKDCLHFTNNISNSFIESLRKCSGKRPLTAISGTEYQPTCHQEFRLLCKHHRSPVTSARTHQHQTRVVLSP